MALYNNPREYLQKGKYATKFDSDDLEVEDIDDEDEDEDDDEDEEESKDSSILSVQKRPPMRLDGTYQNKIFISS